MRTKRISDPYLTKQLIAYIGNKRALLDFLYGEFSKIQEDTGAEIFLDPFAGSGAVSRLARHMGFEVHCNDWEPYSQIINSCHITTNNSAVAQLFRSSGGIKTVLSGLNDLWPGSPGYISNYYAPRSTDSADYNTERMFYTQENARFIDTLRERIEDLYPDSSAEKNILLSALLYECATHVNTSGVFKAYHKGFGGHGGDALNRILARIELEVPVLIDRPNKCSVSCEDAQTFVSSITGDICYLDPPYNSHQYGSNYHLLNTIALWDKPPIDKKIGLDGKLEKKAGIRADWTKTKSAFCYRTTAFSAFKSLLQSVDTRFVTVSYNTEGIVPFDELFELLSEQGQAQIAVRSYTVYRGGRQSLHRRDHNQEMLLILDRYGKTGVAERKKKNRFRIENRLRGLLQGSFHSERLKKTFEFVDGKFRLLSGSDIDLLLPCFEGYRFTDTQTDLSPYADRELVELTSSLMPCLLKDRQEEVYQLVKLLKKAKSVSEQQQLVRFLARALKKYAFKKYRFEYEESLVMLRPLESEFPLLRQELQEIDRIATLRFSG